jgi:AcrR family transcriptional regulator
MAKPATAASGKVSERTASGARTAQPASKRRPGGAASAPYHHGALRDALLAAAEAILERDGVQGLTLRAAAREAGVSHAAPTHHFGDLTGLLSELAAVGFRRFGAALQADARNAGSARRLDAMGLAYVAFARRHPGLFMLMFRGERLDMTRPALSEAAGAAIMGLAGAVAARRGAQPGPGALPVAQAADMVRAWALVHGLAMLLLDRRLDPLIARLPDGADADALLRAVLGGDKSHGAA